MASCERCGEDLTEGQGECGRCGASVAIAEVEGAEPVGATTQASGAATAAPTVDGRTESPTKFCAHCGAALSSAAEFCGTCGEATSATATPRSPGTRWTVRIPGQSDVTVDFLTLQGWVREGRVKPETLVIDPINQMILAAKGVPGLFSDKQWTVALILSILLGGLGVDRFYLGHVGVGIGKLLTAGGLGIWWLVDVILIATRNVKDSTGLPLS